MQRCSPLILLALACAVAGTAARAADADKDCPDKPVPVQKKRAVTHPVRTVQVKAHAPAAPAPTVAVVLPPAPPAAVVNCVNVTSGHSDSLSMAWTDWQCVTMQKARLLQSLGKPEAALTLLCSDPQMHDALVEAGTACPQGNARPRFNPEDVERSASAR